MRERLGSADCGSKILHTTYLHQCKNRKQMDRARNGARYFRNPPQPHMCVQDFIQGSDRPCYINVMSWVKIVMPHNTEDSIPLYGGMRILPSSSSQRAQKKQPLIFAVMANPEILKISGKTAKNLSDRDGLIEVMLDFVEAMNPEIRFKRQFSVLKDRDLTGELKDIWLAVHMMRERERMEGVRGRDVVGPEGEWLQVAYETEVTLTEDNTGVAAAAETSVHTYGNGTLRSNNDTEQVSNEEWLCVSRETEIATRGSMDNKQLMLRSRLGQSENDKNIENPPPSKEEEIENCGSSMSNRLVNCFPTDNTPQSPKNSAIPSVSNSTKTQVCQSTSNDGADIVVPQSNHKCSSNKKSDYESPTLSKSHDYNCSESPTNIVQLDHDYNFVKTFKADSCDEQNSNNESEKKGNQLVHQCEKSSIEKLQISKSCDLDKKVVCADSIEVNAGSCLQADGLGRSCLGISTKFNSVVSSEVSECNINSDTDKKEGPKEKMGTTPAVSVP